MEAYAAVLLWVIPMFFMLLVIEVLYGHFTKKQTYTFMDTIASLSSGISMVIKDALGLALVLVSYPFMLKNIGIWEQESTLILFITAFICIDFAQYWIHRLAHKINIFWNKHMIHHSSEEFNLACALRQSISNIVAFNALFLIPAALIGIPSDIIMVLTPLHLFAQFWYHTRHIGKLSLLEYILVTPSQHRVHHAINPIYIDKNLSAIFCVWDRIFGTFQEELEEVPPIYGTLKPSNSWNPIIINYQHLWGITKDAWYSQKWKDKFKIWFMPTGWRPEDVENKFPITPRPVDNSLKYSPFYTSQWKFIAVFHFISHVIMLLFFLTNFEILEFSFRLSFGGVLLFSIFGFTSLMDFYKWAPNFEIIRGSLGVLFFLIPYHQFLQQEYPLITVYFVFYFFITIGIGFWSKTKKLNRKLAI
jgi:alkylglycerol monooxygenase